MSEEEIRKEKRLQKLYGHEVTSFFYTNPSTQTPEQFSLRRTILIPPVPVKDRADINTEVAVLSTIDGEGNRVFYNEGAWVRDSTQQVITIFSRESYSMRDKVMRGFVGGFNEGVQPYRLVPGIGAATIVTAMETYDVPLWYSGGAWDMSDGPHSGISLYTRVIPTYYGDKVMQDFDEKERRYRLRLRRV